MESWAEIRRWRRAQRTRLVADRMAMPAPQRAALAAAIAAALADMLRRRFGAAGFSIGFFWPLRGEPDLRPFVRGLIERGAAAALPVVVERNAPLEFWRWDADTRMTRQRVWGIPGPAERIAVAPQVLLIPLIGFDGDCHRLGHGGGYYDRTLASFDPRPYAIGVGFDHGRLETIYPQPHDVPMDLIVTEARVLSRESRDDDPSHASGAAPPA